MKAASSTLNLASREPNVGTESVQRSSRIRPELPLLLLLRLNSIRTSMSQCAKTMAAAWPHTPQAHVSRSTIDEHLPSKGCGPDRGSQTQAKKWQNFIQVHV